MSTACHVEAPDEDAQLRSVALSNAQSILATRCRADEEWRAAKDALERTAAELSEERDAFEVRVRERTAELETALRVKEEFLSRASYELRTPMAQMLGFAQLLSYDPLTTDQQESVRHILTSGNHLLSLIDRILAVSQSAPEGLLFLEECR